MTRPLQGRCWLGLFGLAWLLTPQTVHAWGTSIPMHVDSVFIYRFDLKVGPSAFARPAAPWYTYFPVDPHLNAQPAASAFPNWPTQFPSAPAPMSTGGPVTYQMPAPASSAGYYRPQMLQATGYYAPAPGVWYSR